MPAVNRWVLVEHKKAIEATAHALIAEITGVAVASFGLDLHEGRVVNSVEEFAATTRDAARWGLASVTGPPDAL
ncbi:hypothetical protein [Nocardia jiangxiensis]|uniref:hypothetical protein n=1 Tax=Nocardia jiangxiensis TaxID=282685 RepID=UPI0002FBCCAB|nr:hypothetical protein [Nocardia jiangxiensis]